MASLSITGAGFDAEAGVQVHFFDKAGFSAHIPANDVNLTSLTVSVPAYIEPGTETISAGVVSVQVVQKTKTDTLTTNTVEGLQITDVPAYQGTLGIATLEYLDGIIQLIHDSQYHLYALEEISEGTVTDPTLSDCLTGLEADYLEIKAQVQSIIDDPNKTIELATVKLPTGETFSMTLNIEAISTIDQLVSLYNQRLSSTMNSGLTTALSTPKVVFMSWKTGGGVREAPLQADETPSNQPWRIHGQTIQDAQQKLKTATDCATVVVAMANPDKSPNAPGGTMLKPMARDRVASGWLASTFISGAGAMAQDYSAASAATGSEEWKQGRDFISGIFTKLVDHLIFGDSQVDSPNKSFRDLIYDATKKTSTGILISQSPIANTARQDAITTGRLPQESGLALVYSTTPPAVPDSLAGLWTGSGWSYDCCEDDGTRLSRITWDVSVFIISQNDTDVVGKITLKVVKQEIIDYQYWRQVSSEGPEHLMDGKTAQQFLYFHTPGKAWNWEISADRMSIDGYFEAAGPGTWCVGKTFHLAKFR